MTINLTTEIIGLAVTILLAIITAAVTIGRAFNKISNNEKAIKDISKDIKGINSSIAAMNKNIGILIGKMSTIFNSSVGEEYAEAHSPLRLNNKGEELVKNSKIKSILSPHKDYILEIARKMEPENSFQAQQAVFMAVSEYVEKTPEVKNVIEESAFQIGSNPESIIFVGSLDMRDDIMEKLGFAVSEIDKHTPKKK